MKNFYLKDWSPKWYWTLKWRVINWVKNKYSSIKWRLCVCVMLARDEANLLEVKILAKHGNSLLAKFIKNKRLKNGRK